MYLAIIEDFFPFIIIEYLFFSSGTLSSLSLCAMLFSSFGNSKQSNNNIRNNKSRKSSFLAAVGCWSLWAGLEMLAIANSQKKMPNANLQFNKLHKNFLSTFWTLLFQRFFIFLLRERRDFFYLFARAEQSWDWIVESSRCRVSVVVVDVAQLLQSSNEFSNFEHRRVGTYEYDEKLWLLWWNYDHTAEIWSILILKDDEGFKNFTPKKLFFYHTHIIFLSFFWFYNNLSFHFSFFYPFFHRL